LQESLEKHGNEYGWLKEAVRRYTCPEIISEAAKNKEHIIEHLWDYAAYNLTNAEGI
jgi:hypothetical protein